VYGVYTVSLAEESPNMRSYTVWTLKSGQPLYDVNMLLNEHKHIRSVIQQDMSNEHTYRGGILIYTTGTCSIQFWGLLVSLFKESTFLRDLNRVGQNPIYIYIYIYIYMVYIRYFLQGFCQIYGHTVYGIYTYIHIQYIQHVQDIEYIQHIQHIQYTAYTIYGHTVYGSGQP
jgi:hypothetical protein